PHPLHISPLKKSVASRMSICTRRHARHVAVVLRSGAGGMVPFPDIAYRLVAAAIAEVGQGTHNALIPPRTMLAGHPNHEAFELFRKTRPANRLWELSTSARPIRV